MRIWTGNDGQYGMGGLHRTNEDTRTQPRRQNHQQKIPLLIFSLFTGTILPSTRKTTPSSAPSHPSPPNLDSYPLLRLENLEPNAFEKPSYRLLKPDRVIIHSGLETKPHYLSISLADNPDLLIHIHRSSLTVSPRTQSHQRPSNTTNQKPSCGCPDHNNNNNTQHI